MACRLSLLFPRSRLLYLCRLFLLNKILGRRTYLYRSSPSRLYLPFVKWSLFFLFIHNLLFPLGLLSETFGNAAGGVTHPYSWMDFSTRFWSILVNMSGYDTFLAGAFWFFRALFISSIAFLVVFKLLRKLPECQSNKAAGFALLLLPLIVICWKTFTGFSIAGIAQGGYRELMGMAFMATGFLLRQYRINERLTLRLALTAFAVFLLCVTFFPSSMAWRPDFKGFITLPLPAVTGFVCLLYLSNLIDRGNNYFKRLLVYIGDRTLYVFGFHILSFKAVSAIAVPVYALPWEAVGSHPVIPRLPLSPLWSVLYLIAGVALPLLWLEGWKRVEPKIRITLTLTDVADYGLRFLRVVSYYSLRAVKAAGRAIVSGARSFWEGIKAIIAASDTKDE